MPKLSQVLRTNSSIKWLPITTNYNASAGDGLLVLNSLTLIMPDSPAIGDVIQLTLLNNSEAIVERNTKLINGTPTNLTLSKPSLIHTLIYTGITKGWFYSSGDAEGITELAQNIAGNPGPKQYYGTNIDSIKGFYDVPDVDKTKIPLSSIKDINAIVIGANTL